MFDDLRLLRNKAIDAAIRGATAPSEGAKDDLGLDEEDGPVPPKKRKVLQDLLPAVIEVTVPTDGDGAPVRIKMATSSPTEPVTLEFSPETLTCLRNAVTKQLSEAPSSGAAEPSASNSGVTWVASKNAFRVKFTDPEGNNRYKHFKEKKDTVALVERNGVK